MKLVPINIVIITGVGNILSLKSVVADGPTLTLNTIKFDFACPGNLTVNLEKGGAISRMMKAAAALCLVFLAVKSRIPIKLYAPHLVNIYSNYIAYQANILSVTYLYDGLLNIIRPDEAESTALFDAASKHARRLGLEYVKYSGDLIGLGVPVQKDTVYPEVIHRMSGLAELKNTNIEIEKVAGPSTPYLFFFDEPIESNAKEIDFIVNLIKHKTEGAALQIHVFLHPTQDSPSEVGLALCSKCGATVKKSNLSAEDLYRKHVPKIVAARSSTAVINTALASIADTDFYLFSIDEMVKRMENRDQIFSELKRLRIKIGCLDY